MSINSKEAAAGGSSIQDDLQLFVDRHRYVREFVSALHRQPPDERVLFFYGVGGVGKSLMLRYLRVNCCRVVAADQWQAVDALGDEEFRAAFPHVPAMSVPVALHDFSAHVVGDDDPCDPFHGPLMLRAQLGRLGFSFPRFDFAVVLYAQRKQYSSEKLSTLLPSSDAGVTAELLSFLIDNSKVASIASFAVSKLFERYGETAGLAYRKHKAPDEQVAEIYGLEVETELVPLLPRYLAEDLNEQLERRDGKAKEGGGHVCLLFDTHDAFWAERHFGGTEAQRHVRDEWFRTLLRNLDLERAHVAITGRERPRWPAASREEIPAQYLHEVAVGDLDHADADLFLTERGVGSESTRASILEALETETGVHPLSLGLAADLVSAGASKGEDLPDVVRGGALDFSVIGPKLLDRLLSYLPAEECQAISALGACRSFDRELYLMLGRELSFAASIAAFSEIKRLSFVIPYVAVAGQESFKIHTLLRKSLIESSGDVVQAAHAALARHYASSAQTVGDPSHLEQLFHTSRLVGRRDEAVEEWLDALLLACDAVDTPMLSRVLGLEDEFALSSWEERARLARGRQCLYSTQGRDEDARAVLLEAITEGLEQSPSAERTRLLLAELYLQLGWVERYRTRFEEADAAFRAGADLAQGGGPESHHMLGRMYFGWSGTASDAGDLRTTGERLRSASLAYEAGRERLGAATPMRWLSDASFTEACLAANGLARGAAGDAERDARKAVDLAEQATAMSPDDVRGLMNLEAAYGALSAALADRDLQQALEAADLGVAACERLLLLQKDVTTRPAGRVLARAQLRRRAGDLSGALADVRAGVEQARELCDLKPKQRASHEILARALLLQAELEPTARRESLVEASTSASRALALAPNWLQARELRDAVDDALTSA